MDQPISPDLESAWSLANDAEKKKEPRQAAQDLVNILQQVTGVATFDITGDIADVEPVGGYASQPGATLVMQEVVGKLDNVLAQLSEQDLKDPIVRDWQRYADGVHVRIQSIVGTKEKKANVWTRPC